MRPELPVFQGLLPPFSPFGAGRWPGRPARDLAGGTSMATDARQTTGAADLRPRQTGAPSRGPRRGAAPWHSI